MKVTNPKQPIRASCTFHRIPVVAPPRQIRRAAPPCLCRTRIGNVSIRAWDHIVTRTASRDTLPPPPPPPTTNEAGHRKRTSRLECLICLRRLYRNLVRGKAYETAPLGVYTAIKDDELAEMLTEEDRFDALEDRKLQALHVLADIHVTIEELEGDLRTVLPDIDTLFEQGEGPQSMDQYALNPKRSSAISGREVKQQLESLMKTSVASLADRIEQELPLLPYPNLEQARTAVASVVATQLAAEGEVVRPKGFPNRMEAVQRASAVFFGGRLKPAVQNATNIVAEEGLSEAVKASSQYVKGLWGRLNGKGAGSGTALPFGLQNPSPCQSRIDAVEVLNYRIDKLEKELVELSKQREQRLRSTAIEYRATLAYEMRDMDQAVLTISRELALCTLKVQLEYVYMALEDETRQILDADAATEPRSDACNRNQLAEALALWRLAPRRGSSEELAILVAEYSLLSGQLATLTDALSSSNDTMTSALDEDLKALASAIPDMRVRLGIVDQDVFGGSGLSVRKAQMAVKDTATKLQEGADFFIVGLKMLGSDLAYAGRLFARAALFNTLKPREVSALRRTVKDMFAFIPFTIILIIPLTPLGHVLIFGFIQRIFPNFFPSQFNARRQEMAKRYEALRLELVQAQEAADQDEEKQELRQAAAVVARLTNPSLVGGGSTPPTKQQAKRVESSDGGIPSQQVQGQVDSTGDGIEAQQVIKNLKKKVDKAGFEALTFNNEEDSDKTRRVGQ